MFRCRECSKTNTKWSGRCANCNAWGSLEEAPDEPKSKRTQKNSDSAKQPVDLHSFLAQNSNSTRMRTGTAQIDFVFGGGIVPGSLVLISGEPGIGKSTLVMQIAASAKESVLYVSGEESGNQIALRLHRLKESETTKTHTQNHITANIQFLGTTDFESIADAIKKQKPSLAIIDSVQTMRHPDVAGEAGGVAQIRAVTNALLELANETNVPIILIGHVTKDGSVAGPKTLEHLVDVVLSIEGERSDRLRFIRCFKNRFGPTDEVAVLEMTSAGLKEVADPSGLLLSERSLPVPGSVVTCLMDGNRPLLVEIQALTTRTTFGFPQRRANGVDLARLQILLAVLGRRMGLPVDEQDVFINVVGGVRADEPAADLAICMAIASSIADKTIPHNVIAFGEVGLSGEIRRVSHTDKRLREAETRGFQFALVPCLQDAPKLSKLKIAQLTDVKSILEKIEK